MRHWMRSSLRRRLSLVMLVATVVPLLFLGGLSYVFSSRITENNAKNAETDTLRQMEGHFRFMIQDIENMTLFLIGLSDVQTWLNGNTEDEALQTRVSGLITNLVSSKNYISDITIYPKDSAQELSTANIYQTELPRLLDIRQVESKIWTRLYPITTYAGTYHVISFVRPLRTIGTYQTVGWLSVSLDERTISRYWADPELDHSVSTIALLNESGDMISSTDKTWLNQSVETIMPGTFSRFGKNISGAVNYGEGPDKKTVIYYREPLLGWTLIHVLPYSQFSAQNRFILFFTVISIVGAVVATSGMVLLFIQRVTKPLTVLSRLLVRMDPEQPLPHYPVTGSDEVGRLAASYNMLGTQISKLKEQLIRNETRKKEADMRALQAQINPHFLYNTLSSIHWISLMTGEKRISEMVGALSDFLRFSLNKGKDYCTVQQEIAHISNYSKVQTIRYPDKFELDYVVDPTALETVMLKLLLQPLVENAMVHGIQKKTGKGRITVYVERSGAMLNFFVDDDGVGMDGERLAQVRRQLELDESRFEREGSSYGLRNVHERLKLHYGPEFGLRIESRLKEGTRVSFMIPVLEVPHENHDRG